MSGRFRQIFRTTIGGATMGVATAVISCTLAIGIEGAANKALFKVFPHWYNDVQYAYGVNSQLLANSPAREVDVNKEIAAAEEIATWSY
jgi:hypothetical protein